MLKGWRWRLLLWCVLLPALPLQAQEPLHLRHAEVLTLDDLDSAIPYEAKEADLQGAWQPIALPYAPVAPSPSAAADSSPSERSDSPTLVTWYRLKLPLLAASSEQRYIYLPRWQCNGQIAVYADQRLLYQSSANLFWNGWNIPLWIPLPEMANDVSPQQIYLRLEHPRHAGGGISTLWLGASPGLSWRYHLRFFLQVRLPFMGGIAFLMAGIFSLLLWFRHRGETLYLLLFLMSLTSLVRTLHFLIGDNPLFMSWAWVQWWGLNSLLWLTAVVHFVLNQLHQRITAAFDRGIFMGVAAGVLLISPVWGVLPEPALPRTLAHALVVGLGIVVGLVGIAKSGRAHSSDGRLLGAWCVVTMLLALNDSLLQSNPLAMEGVYLGPYASLLAFLLFLFIMVRRYMAAITAVRQLNADLSLRLQEREAQLLVFYAEQRAAEKRQTLVAERQRMMQDMHDGMGSSLRTALLAVEGGQLNAAMVADVLKDCIDDLKLAIDAMEPVQADLLLLLATLRFRLGPRLEAAGISLRWEVENVPPLDWLDPRNALHILRIVQEAFTNIIKHTRASEIRVATTLQGDAVVVSLTDNGPGFDVARGLASPGRGLNNQLHRAEAIGAQMEWESSPSGVCVRLHLPIRR